MADQVVTVSDTVLGRDSQGRTVVRWAVVATFVGIDGAEPRCVDYRVRVVPEPPAAATPTPAMWSIVAGGRVLRAMEAAAITADEAEQLGEVPAEGIPRRVFEQASQARLLAKGRAAVQRRPDRHGETARALLERPTNKRGRPPVRSLGEKLRILADVEAAYEGDGRTLADVAGEHNMSRSAVRDLLGWARHDADPPLFVSYGPGRRGGHLTPQGRAMLDQLDNEEG